MTEIIIGQVRFVLVTAFWGMALMAGYDILRFVRWLLPHLKLVVAIEDICYWCIMAIPTYVVFFVFNDGEIRWYGALAVLLGGVLYEKGIGRHIRNFGHHHLTKPKNRLLRLFVKLKNKITKKHRERKAERKRVREEERKEKTVIKEEE